MSVVLFSSALTDTLTNCPKFADKFYSCIVVLFGTYAISAASLLWDWTGDVHFPPDVPPGHLPGRMFPPLFLHTRTFPTPMLLSVRMCQSYTFVIKWQRSKCIDLSTYTIGLYTTYIQLYLASNLNVTIK